MLTEEVGKKSNFITNLEQEKSALIKQLFQARSLLRPASAMGAVINATGHHVRQTSQPMAAWNSGSIRPRTADGTDATLM